MPIYEYRCNQCGEFEIMQKITKPGLKRCPTCQGKVTKLISNTSFQLKGSGWYATDYARKGSAHDGADGSADGKGKAADTKTESSTAAGEKKESTPSKSSEPSAA
jgi:putative FmdB family regulatory protein